MFDWLFEGRLAVYLILAVPAVVLLALYARDRKRGWLYALGVAVLLGGVYFLLDRFVETPREQITRKLRQMAAAVKKQDGEAIFKHISPQFKFGVFDKAGFRKAVEGMMKLGTVDELTVWDIDVPDATGKVKFRAKPRGNRGEPPTGFIVRGEFVKESDGEWRLRTFTVHKDFADSEAPFDVGPYMPQ